MAVNFECVEIALLNPDYEVTKQTSGRMSFQVLDEQNNLLIRFHDTTNWIGVQPAPEIQVYRNTDCARYGKQAFLINCPADTSYILFFDTLSELCRFELLVSDYRNGRKKSVFKQVCTEFTFRFPAWSCD